MKNVHSALGKNQRIILKIISDLSIGQHFKNIRYCGGNITNRQRCVSIGRECSLFYDIPLDIVDLRLAMDIFRQIYGSRLGTNCQKSFNRGVHALVRKRMIIPLSAEFITHKRYNHPAWKEEIINISNDKQRSYLRFVMIVPNAFSTKH